jgi:hypothetical protein
MTAMHQGEAFSRESGRARLATAVPALLLAIVMSSHAGAAILDPQAPPVPLAPGGRVPQLTDTWQWQLLVDETHPLDTSYDVAVYDIDMEETPASTIAELRAAGRYVVCYFSAGSYEAFRSDAGQFLPSDLGAPLDPPFGDELWLDINSDNVQRVMRDRLDRAREKGCNAVEPDNVDGFDNDNGMGLTAEQQVAYNKFIANAAHERGLAVGLKNDLEQVSELLAYFDFSVNEQCHQYKECGELQPFLDAGKPVFNAEYARKFVRKRKPRAKLCKRARRLGLHTLALPIELDNSFRHSCDP